MKIEGDPWTAWALLVAGGLWLCLVGACTVGMVKGDEYGFWVIGAGVTALGLIPFFAGLWRVAGPRIGGWSLIATGVIGGGWLLAHYVASHTGAHHIDTSEFIWTLAVFILGPPALLIVWGLRLLRRAGRKGDADD